MAVCHTLSVSVFQLDNETTRLSRCSHARHKAIKRSPAFVMFPCILKVIGNIPTLVLFPCAAQSYKKRSCTYTVQMRTRVIGNTAQQTCRPRPDSKQLTNDIKEVVPENKTWSQISKPPVLATTCYSAMPDLPVTHFSPFSTWLSVLFFFPLPLKPHVRAGLWVLLVAAVTLPSQLPYPHHSVYCVVNI